MAISYVGRAGSANGATSVSTFSATTSSNIAAGDLIVVTVACSNVGDTTNLKSVTDSVGNTYVSAGFAADGGQNQLIAVWYCENCTALPSGDTVTVTLNSALLSSGGGESWEISVDNISGAATTSVVDQQSFGTIAGSVTPWATSSITTTNAADLLWVAFGDNQGETSAIVNADCLPTSGWTVQTGIISSNQNGHRTAYQVVSATGTYKGGGTDNTVNNGMSAGIVAFKAAGGGGSVNGSATVLAFAGVGDGLSGQAGINRGINAGPGVGGGINGNAAIGHGLAGQGEIQASSQALASETFQGEGSLGSGIAGQGEVNAQSQALDQATIQSQGAVGTGQSGSGAFGRGFSGSGGVSTGLSGFAGFIMGLAGQALVTAAGTLGGYVNGVANILGLAGFIEGFGGHGDVHGSNVSLNQATVTGAGNVQSNFLAGIANIIASSIAAVHATILSGAGLGGGQAGSGSTEAVSAATPGLTIEGSGTLGGGLFAGLAALAASGGIARFPPFRIAITAVQGLINLALSVKANLSQSVTIKPLLTLSFLLEPPVAYPNSTITVTATATDINGNPVSNMATVTVTVTFPDASTQNFSLSGATVTNAGSGKYTITYNTKTPGQNLEDWVMIDPTGNKTEYHNITPVGF